MAEMHIEWLSANDNVEIDDAELPVLPALPAIHKAAAE